MTLARQIILLCMLVLTLFGCTNQSIKKETNATIEPLESEDLSSILEGVTFHYSPQQSETLVPFWVTYEEDTQHHVPWFIGKSVGEEITASELILIDPVNKTVSIGFDQGKEKIQLCHESVSVQDRLDLGYSLCTSQLAKRLDVEEDEVVEKSVFDALFGAKEAPVDNAPAPIPVRLDAYRLAVMVKQLNLFPRAQGFLDGDFTQSADASNAENYIRNIRNVKRSYERKFEEVQKDYVASYRKGAKKNLNISRKVKDRSGFFGYDLDWDDNVRLSPLPYEIKQVRYEAFLAPLLGETFTDATGPLMRIVADRIKEQFEKDKAHILDLMKRELAYYKVLCMQPENSGDYQFEVDCPSKLSLTGRNLAVEYRIVARKFGLAMPSYAMYNADVSLESGSDAIIVTNNASKQLWVKSIALKANGQSQSIYESASEGQGYLIKSGESLSLNLRNKLSDEMRKALAVPYINRRNASREKMTFGYMVTYMVDGVKQVQSLAELRDYKLDNVLLSLY